MSSQIITWLWKNVGEKHFWMAWHSLHLLFKYCIKLQQDCVLFRLAVFLESTSCDAWSLKQWLFILLKALERCLFSHLYIRLFSSFHKDLNSVNKLYRQCWQIHTQSKKGLKGFKLLLFHLLKGGPCVQYISLQTLQDSSLPPTYKLFGKMKPASYH